MNWRRDELPHFGDRIAWLDQGDAAGAYARVLPLMSRSHYGFDPSTVADVEGLDVEGAGPEVDAWLSRRIGGGSVLLVFDHHNVCRMDGSSFVGNWQDLLCPSRDDAIILPVRGSGVLFYCHEDEFEFGRRLTA